MNSLNHRYYNETVKQTCGQSLCIRLAMDNVSVDSVLCKKSYINLSFMIKVKKFLGNKQSRQTHVM